MSSRAVEVYLEKAACETRGGRKALAVCLWEGGVFFFYGGGGVCEACCEQRIAMATGKF